MRGDDFKETGAALADGSRARRPRGPRTTRRVTMTDVAQVAGCSQTTVSFVLNGTPGIKISDATRSRVMEAARSLGYVTSPSAHAPIENGRHTLDGAIGFVSDQIATSPEAAVAIEGARQAAWDGGSLLLVAQTLNDPEMEPRTIRTLASQGISGLVYMTIFTRKIVPPPILYRLNVPVVLLNCYSDDHAFSAVVPSEIAGGESLTRHLVRLGHRRIGTITGEPWMDAAKDRLKGYRRALANGDIAYDQQLVIPGDWSASAGYKGTMALLDLPDPPSAIFCQNDRTAIGCYEALKERGLRIPDDVSVVGYDDEEIARHLHPQLTTAILPHRAMGRWAVEHLRTTSLPGERHQVAKLECPLVDRQSAAPPPVSSRT